MSSTLRNRTIPIQMEKPSSTASPSTAKGEESDSDESLLDLEFDSEDSEWIVPNFTVKDLLSAIPPHCFNRSALHSSLYVFRDFSLILTYMYLASKINFNFNEKDGILLNGLAGNLVGWAMWGAYWVMAGFSFTGIWIIGHECGHQAFSSSKSINNSVGLILHSLLLVPYHAWRISHSKHHAATGHMNRDEVFVPPTKSQVTLGLGLKGKVGEWYGDLDEILEDAPVWRLGNLVGQQVLGWPIYLFVNATGRSDYKGANHFSPSSPIFDARHFSDIVLSDLCLALMGVVLYGATEKWGVGNVWSYYGVPYLVTNHWLVMITYLQHTSPVVPHYRAEVWNFARGALCTVDRNMLGWVGPYLLHGICETHVSHHISSKIPHYHAWEATDALKAYLGDAYQSCDENMFVSLWKNFKSCKYVEDEGQIVFYKDAHGKSSMRDSNGKHLNTKSAVGAGGVSDSGVDVE